jgi:hypothetical protein
MAAAILAVRRPMTPDVVLPKSVGDLARLFALDRPSLRRELVCHWRRDADGRLACVWEPDIVPVSPQERRHR